MDEQQHSSEIPINISSGKPDAKRRRERDGEVPAPAKRVRDEEVIFRIIVPSRQIGKVIGKSGQRIQKIREESKATIKIADAKGRHEERVIIISSKDIENQVMNAEIALQLISTLILKVDDDISTDTDMSKLAAANTIRLLIAGSQAGSLIGMSGQNIEKIRTLSGATITILAPNQLPLLCASQHESDRVVQISGDVPVVLKALQEIGVLLRENPPRQVVSITPAYSCGNIRPPQPHVDPFSAEYVKYEMMISEAFIGGLIGKCGSHIAQIRSESGATIKVCGGKGEQQYRQIQFGGSAQQVALARQKVDEYVYSQMLQQASFQQTPM
ncbi:hypothetical protein ACFE04_018654 [Oxalis oulophora]